MTGNSPKCCSLWISLAKFWYNTRFHTTIKITPFQAVFGIPPQLHLPYILKDSSVEVEDKTLQDREVVIQFLKNSISKAQQRMITQGNKHKTDRNFHNGDMVYLILQPYNFQSCKQSTLGLIKLQIRLFLVHTSLDLPPSTNLSCFPCITTKNCTDFRTSSHNLTTC